MARFNRNFLHGALGPVVFKQVGNAQFLTSKVKAGTMRQTKNTKKAANTFGMASRLGAQIRGSFESEIYTFRDTEMHSRLSAELNTLLSHVRDLQNDTFNFEMQSFAPLNGFEFNKYSPLKKHLIANPAIDVDAGRLNILFPDQEMLRLVKFPAKAVYCEIVASVALFRLEEGMRVQVPEQQHFRVMKDDNKATGQSISFDVPDGCCCIVGIFLQYFSNHFPLNSVKLNPGAICYTTITPDVYPGTDPHFWIDMLGLKFG